MKQPKIETCSDCGGVHEEAFGLLMNMVKAIRLAPDEAIAALCASILESNVVHWGTMTGAHRILHAKVRDCMPCQPNQILGAIVDDFAPVPRKKALAKAMAEKAEREEKTDTTATVN